ncbi:MAG: EpsI family protein [Candidatus Omnitrophica bacterium]|nr:EpsI family protein [Candidatus Omnitrophota bacterium]
MKRHKTDIPFYLIIAMSLIAGIISWRIYFKVYRQDDTVNIHYFPKQIEDWTAEEIPISDDDKAMLETDNVFIRRYANARDEEVFLFVVYSQNNRKVSHPPEICYTGGGAAILNNVHDSFVSAAGGEEIQVNRLRVERGGAEQIFVYWFKVGDSFTSNYWVQQGQIALRSFLGRPASSALIRISSTVKNGKETEATEVIKKFGRLIVSHLLKYLP